MFLMRATNDAVFGISVPQASPPASLSLSLSLYCIVPSAITKNSLPNWTMEDSKNLALQAEEQKNPFIVFFTNLVSSIKLPFPPKKNGAKSEPAAADSQAAEPLKLTPPVAADDDSKPGVVTFPRQNLEPIKLEAETDLAGQTTNPLILWQVLIRFARILF